MKILESDKPSTKFHEVQITIDDSEGYAEIVEVCRAGREGPVFVIVTSVTTIDPSQYVPGLINNLGGD
jgi:hypothetical protein